MEEYDLKLDCVAQRSGLKVYTCEIESIPLMAQIRLLDKRLRKSGNDYMLILISKKEEIHHEWVVPVKTLEKRVLVPVEYTKIQQLDFLYSKIDDLSFGLEERTTILDVTTKVNAAFIQNSEKVTKDFYAGFRKQHKLFVDFVSGIDEKKNREWYVSVMLNRLMFCYFIQKKGFLDSDTNYLRNKLEQCKKKQGSDRFFKSFYRSFLLKLFHEGLNDPHHETKEFREKFGRIPYLNGGMFDAHQLEKLYSNIDIKDEAFEKLFDFFDKYNWHLDTRIEASGKDINPDVIGYIFEQYINDRSNMGAYYTKEDITNHIAKNCILPFVWEKIESQFDLSELWKFLQNNPDLYIFNTIKKGVFCDGGEKVNLPSYIQKGINCNQPDLLEKRREWNYYAPEMFGLPKETWREIVARRNYFSDLRNRISRGEILSIKDFITYNLDIISFTQDFLNSTRNYDVIKSFFQILQNVTILDPTCGSGAFLFAAMNILEPLYDICIDRMEDFNKLDESLFREELHEIYDNSHKNRAYYIYKSIIIKNLYGVDLMPEAIEIAKLRLFLKLVAVVEKDPKVPNYGLDPLPDIDFNLRCGNTLVGFAINEDILSDFSNDLFLRLEWEEKLNHKLAAVSSSYRAFKGWQFKQAENYSEFRKSKEQLKNNLQMLDDDLNNYIFGKKEKNEEKKFWVEKVRPFHWFSEFFEIVHGNGGFDVIIGNPPYVEYSKTKNSYSIDNYKTEKCGNLYAFVLERCLSLVRSDSYIGMIVQLPIVCTDRMIPAQNILTSRQTWIETFDDRPGKLFDNLEHIRATIFITTNTGKGLYTTKYNRWYSETREDLFNNIRFSSGIYFPYSIPKCGNSLDHKILKKIQRKRISGNFFDPDKCPYKLYYHNAPQYFSRCTDFIPLFERNGKQQTSTHVKSIFLLKKEYIPLFGCVYNSSLFMWYFVLFSNCRDLGSREIQNFPFDPELIDSTSQKQFESLFTELMYDYKVKSFRKSCTYKTGSIVYDEYYPKLSKSVIDKIDMELGKYYGFSTEELDYIINYDIKYRMGDELEASSDAD